MLDRDGTASRSVVMARCHVQRDSASMVDCDICLDVPFGLVNSIRANGVPIYCKANPVWPTCFSLRDIVGIIVSLKNIFDTHSYFMFVD